MFSIFSVLDYVPVQLTLFYVLVHELVKAFPKKYGILRVLSSMTLHCVMKYMFPFYLTCIPYFIE